MELSGDITTQHVQHGLSEKLKHMVWVKSVSSLFGKLKLIATNDECRCMGAICGFNLYVTGLISRMSLADGFTYSQR